MNKVKECLKSLIEQNFDMSINKHVNYLIENMEDDQLLYKLSSSGGVKIDNNMIHLWYHNGIGFTCKNILVEKYGKLPICNRIERHLNSLL